MSRLRINLLRIYTLGCISGVAGGLSQQPFRLWPLVFFALAGIYILISSYVRSRDRHYFFSVVLAWMVYAGIMCDWISYFGTGAYIAFLCAEAIFIATFTYVLARYCQKCSPLIFATAWVLFEWILGHIPVLGFTWLSIATTMIDTPMALLARSTGSSALTFLLALASAFFVEIIRHYCLHREHDEVCFKKTSFISSFAIFAVIVLLCVPHFSRPEKTRSIAVIQGNDKNRYLTQKEIDSNYLENSHIGLARSLDHTVDFLIFPESAFRDDPENDAGLHNKLKSISYKARSVIIVNSIAEASGGDVNRNYFYSPSMQLQGTYDKKRLVPFGEYVPGERIIGSWSIFDDIGTGFVAGTRDRTINGVTTLICFESAFTQDVRQALNGQSRVLVVTTNNRSYRRSGNSAQHLAQSRLRAVEYGIPVVHASVSGSSAIVSARGEVLSRSNLFERTVIFGRISPQKPSSFYAKTFDWLSLGCLLGLGYGCLVSLRKNRWKNQISRN